MNVTEVEQFNAAIDALTTRVEGYQRKFFRLSAERDALAAQIAEHQQIFLNHAEIIGKQDERIKELEGVIKAAEIFVSAQNEQKSFYDSLAANAFCKLEDALDLLHSEQEKQK